MSVYKDSFGKWRYRSTVTLKDGSSVRISGTASAANTKLAAREAEDAHRYRTVNPAEIAPLKKLAPGFSTFATTWLKAYPSSADNRSSTITEKEQHVRVHLVPYFKDMPIDRITSMEIATMIAYLKGKPKKTRGGNGRIITTERTISAKTVRNVTQTLHKILVTASEWGVLASEVPKFPKRKKVDAPWDFYTSEESGALLASVGTTKRHREKNSDAIEDFALLLFALKTGARAGEQIAITWGDIDWQGRKVHFRRQYHKGEFRELKAGPSRSVDLSASLIEALKAWRARQITALDVARGNSERENPRDLIFPLDAVTATPRETWHLRDILERYSRRAGLRRIKWHELRHSFASQLVSGGVPLKQVQEWLGHSTIHMTMRYAHLAPTSGAGFIGVLDRPVSSERT